MQRFNGKASNKCYFVNVYVLCLSSHVMLCKIATMNNTRVRISKHVCLENINSPLIFVLSTFTLWTFEQRNFLFATFRRSKPLKVLSTKISGLLMFFKHMCNCRESPDFPSLFLSFHFQKHPPRGHHLGKYE